RPPRDRGPAADHRGRRHLLGRRRGPDVRRRRQPGAALHRAGLPGAGPGPGHRPAGAARAAPGPARRTAGCRTAGAGGVVTTVVPGPAARSGRAAFGARLRAALDARGPLCVGIDPHGSLLRAWGLSDDVAGLERFSRTAVEALADRVAVLKPQSA